MNPTLPSAKSGPTSAQLARHVPEPWRSGLAECGVRSRAGLASIDVDAVAFWLGVKPDVARQWRDEARAAEAGMPSLPVPPGLDLPRSAPVAILSVDAAAAATLLEGAAHARFSNNGASRMHDRPRMAPGDAAVGPASDVLG